MLFLLLFLNAVAFAEPNPIDNDVRDLVQFADEAHVHDRCASLVHGWLKNWEAKKKKFCPTLSRYELGKPLSFDERDPEHPCSIYVGKKPLYSSMDEGQKKHSASYGTADFKPPSYSQKILAGFRWMEPAERKKVYEKAVADGAAVARNCCAGNAKCIEGMSKIKIVFCDNPNADKKPDEPDMCAWAEGYYNRDEEKQKPGTVVPGKITITPYTFSETQMKTMFAHEFGHACSDVWDQIGNDGALNHMFQGEGLNPKACGVTPQFANHYAQSANGVAPGMNDCLVNMAKQHSPKSIAFVPDSCDTRRLEEGYADAIMILAISEQGNIVPEIFPNSCSYSPDRPHPYRGDAFKCVLATSKSVRARLAWELSCPKLSQ